VRYNKEKKIPIDHVADGAKEIENELELKTIGAFTLGA
jgi:hypothetical protein